MTASVNNSGLLNSPYRPLWFSIALFLLGILIYSFTLHSVYSIHAKYVEETISEFGQVPSSGVQVSSVEFKGAFSDYLFFRTMTFFGMRIGEKQLPSQEEWQTIHLMLQRATDLDPMFWDPYVFTEMLLVWQAGMFDEGNALLEKAALNRPWDYRPLYYIGFNHLYFKKDAKSAAPYLRKAAEFANTPSFLKGLAARVSHYAGETGLGIFFLENILQDTEDARMAKYLEKRLTTMKLMLSLEQKVKEFSEKYGHLPSSFQDLVSEGLITELPKDPYGGEFILLENGRVYTTSEMIDKTSH